MKMGRLQNSIQKIASVFSDVNPDVSKFDKAELSAESSLVIKDLIQSIRNPVREPPAQLLLKAPEEGEELAQQKVLILEYTPQEAPAKPTKLATVDIILNDEPQDLREKLFMKVHFSEKVNRSSRIISNNIFSVPGADIKDSRRKTNENKFKEELKQISIS